MPLVREIDFHKPLSEEIEDIHKHIEEQNELLRYNSDILDIYEGELLPFILKELGKQLSGEPLRIAERRAPPINILERLIDKLSKIYQQKPLRYMKEKNLTDAELLSNYENSMQINDSMNTSNEYYNLFKNTLLQPYVHDRKPRLRALPSNLFTVISSDPVDPTNPTHVITFHKAKDTMLYFVFTDKEFMIFDQEQNIRRDLMATYNMEDGNNVIGKIPFVYVNRSKNLLIPKAGKDTKIMVTLLPVMLADLNFANMMQSFSIYYGIDLDDKGIKISPNAFWTFKSDDSTDKTPQLGTLKPEVDTQETLNLIQSEIALWLQTKGVKPGAVGKLTSENYVSGISKMIDEMDTSEEREKQVTKFEKAEFELWDLIINYMHPHWIKTEAIDEKRSWTSGAVVKTDFHQQLPLLNRGDIVRDLRDEVISGFISQRRAIKKLNPKMSDEELNQLIKEIDNERKGSKEVKKEDKQEEGS